MYNDTITLFNRKEGREGDVWYPTVIKNADLNVDKAAILAKYGPETKDTAVLHVRYQNQDGKKIISGKPWVPPKEWEAQREADARNGEPSKYAAICGEIICGKVLCGQLDIEEAITFTEGDRFDFFWLGAWEGADPIEDADYFAYTDFYTYMNKTHDFVFAISSVGGPYSVIPHFEITGK